MRWKLQVKKVGVQNENQKIEDKEFQGDRELGAEP